MEIVKVEEFTSIIQTAPYALEKNKISVSKCNEAGQTLLDTIEASGMTDELDEEVSKYLNKVSATVKNMNERRKPLTQLFDNVRKVFTELEGGIDPKKAGSIPFLLQDARNKYAAKKMAEERRRQEEIRRIQNIENEKRTYRSDIEVEYYNHFNSYLSTQIESLNSTFNSITLDSFEVKSNAIKEWPLSYAEAHFNSLVSKVRFVFISELEAAEIRNSVKSGLFDKYKEQYLFEMEDCRRECVDKLLSKKRELQELEELRKTNAEAALKAEKERVERERVEKEKRELEAKRKEEEERQRQTATIQSATMDSLFSAQATVIPTTKVKVTEKIEILSQQGALECLQMWWLREGQALSIPDLEKIFKKQITFCEKLANKDDERITSKFIRYVEDVKAK